MTSLWQPGVSLLSSLFGQRAANKAAKDQADAILRAGEMQDKRARELSAPFLSAFNWTMPKMQNMIGNLGNKVGKDSEILKSSHELNASNIARDKNRALASSGMFWNRLGNTGKARGEALTIGQNATDATNRENLNYANSQNSYRDNNTMRFMDSLSRLADTGSAGVGIAMGGTNALASGMRDSAMIRGGQAMDNASAYGDIGGGLMTDWMSKLELKKLEQLLNKK